MTGGLNCAGRSARMTTSWPSVSILRTQMFARACAEYWDWRKGYNRTEGTDKLPVGWIPPLAPFDSSKVDISHSNKVDKLNLSCRTHFHCDC